MQIVFRADASIQMGSGHVMRCLTLADALKKRGAHCHFICREHPGSLIALIKSRGHQVTALPFASVTNRTPRDNLAHAHWLGATQTEDAVACQYVLDEIKVDWLVIDHYALDTRWQTAMRHCYKRLLVIDDLADRKHLADVLLDQNLGAQKSNYQSLVPAHCELLMGPHYALLRPEFAEWREYSLNRRQHPVLKRILITLGGADSNNITCQVLNALAQSNLSAGCVIDVVLGASNPWLAEVKAVAQSMPFDVRVLKGVTNMAELMANSDLCIGAAGSTAWERCCVGLPAIMMVLANNQSAIAQHLADIGAALCVKTTDAITTTINAMLQEGCQQESTLGTLSAGAATVTTGEGCQHVINAMVSF